MTPIRVRRTRATGTVQGSPVVTAVQSISPVLGGLLLAPMNLTHVSCPIQSSYTSSTRVQENGVRDSSEFISRCAASAGGDEQRTVDARRRARRTAARHHRAARRRGCFRAVCFHRSRGAEVLRGGEHSSPGRCLLAVYTRNAVRGVQRCRGLVRASSAPWPQKASLAH